MEFQLTTPLLTKRNGSIVFLGDMPFEVKQPSKRVRAFIRSLEKGLTSGRVYAEIDRWPACKRLFEILVSRKAVHRIQKPLALDPRHEKTYAYLKAVAADPEGAWARVRRTHVGILGCGGVGAVVAESLLSMGAHNLSLVDYSPVKASNLNRQTIYCARDIGEPKVQVLRERLLERDPKATIRAHAAHVTNESILERLFDHPPDLLVVAIDTPPVLAQQWVLRYCIQREVACIMSGVGLRKGFVGPLLTEDRHRRAYLEDLVRYEAVVDTEATVPLTPSLGATNLLISAAVALDGFRYLSGCEIPESLNNRIILRFNGYGH